ncbi:MAG: tetratricopeptide repeat protein [Gemmatimonadota bacterium]|nr:tetratricopeptide repeat protein [Gemmatimonadota bacterium]
MSKSAQLKRNAAEFEQKRQFDRALASYAQAIEAAAGIPEELDIPLYNRVGDLHLRLGDLDKAVAYYETAVDLYAEGGFFNNAIALCNKVLRHSPGRTVIYYKLGKISAKKGFNSDAKQNFLEYAARMEKAGDTAEAFRALKEFADLCPGHDDVRLMLAEQLARAGLTQEALEQLQIVYEAMVAEDRGSEATAALERIRALDPNFAPRAALARQQAKREGLVFLDVDYGKRALDASQLSSAPDPASPLTAEAFDEIELPPAADMHVASTLDDSPMAGLTPVEDPIGSMTSEQDRGPSPTLAEFESTAFETGEQTRHMAPLDIEHTSFDAASTTPLASPVAGDGAEERGPHHRSTWPANANEQDSLGSVDGEGSDRSADHLDVERDESMAEMLTGYVASLSSDVGAVEGGLPGDLGILPAEAIEEEQALPPKRADDEYVDLNDWLLEGEEPKNPRMTAPDEDQSQNQVQTDFSEMLETFKAGVAANVDESDSDSHYDLGVAYMEMGLFNEAIAQFQKVMRGDATPERRVRAYESLGQSFIEKNDYEVAISSLSGALKESALTDTKLVGVLYLLGYASEKLARWKDAEGYYRRVFAVDINFRDVGERLRRAEQMA